MFCVPTAVGGPAGGRGGLRWTAGPSPSRGGGLGGGGSWDQGQPWAAETDRAPPPRTREREAEVGEQMAKAQNNLEM